MQDIQIIKLFYERSEGAIEALKSQYGSRALAVAERILGNTWDAEETVNDALHVMWQKIPPEQPAYLWAYFSRVVRNLCCDRLDYRNAARRQQSCEICFEELQGCLSTGDDPQQLLESRQIADVINAFLDGLDRKDRVIFVRRYYYFDSCSQISRMLGLRRGTVNVRLHRLRAQLKKALEKEDITV